MRRSRLRIAALLLALAALPVLALAAEPQTYRQSFLWGIVQDLAQRVLGKDIVIDGLSGSLGDIRIAHAELRDADGAWLTADDLALSWSPLQLVRGVAHFERIAIGRATMLRNQVPSAPAKPSKSSSSSLPVTIRIDALHADRIDIDKPVFGEALAATADGKADLTGLPVGTAQITIQRLDGQGTYKLDGNFGKDSIDAHLDVAEPEHGALSTIANLPSLGALSVQAAVQGPFGAVKTDVSVAAGPLHATANGTVDVNGESADLAVVANAPAMSPSPDISWQAVALNARVHGTFTKPDVTGTAHIAQLAAAGGKVQDFALDIQGNSGQAALRATIAGLLIPGPKPDIFAAAPLQLTADAQLDAANRPVTFALSHPLLNLKGSAQTAGAIAVQATLGVPDLAPLAAAGGVDLAGHTDLTVSAHMAGETRDASIDGTVAITGGVSPAPSLVGPDGKIGITASMTGNDVTLSRFVFDGSNARLSANGTVRNNVVSLDWTAALANLALVAPTLTGALAGSGHVAGPATALAATADLKGTLGTKDFPPGPVEVMLDAQGLPDAPTGSVTASGTVEDAPLQLAARAQRQPDGALAVTIERAGWKSATAQGALTLPPGSTLPLGQVTLRVDRLADFSAIAGQPLGGELDAAANLQPDLATLELRARNAGTSGADVRSADLTARVAHPLANPDVQAQLAITGLRAGTAAGAVRLDLNGTENALALKLATDLENFNGAPLRGNATGTLDVNAMDLRVATLAADWKGETVRLLAPTSVSLKGGLAVDRTRVGVGAAEVTVEGKISPTLDLTASARNVTPALARPFAPSLADAGGTISADARLTGTPTQPNGTVRLTASGVRLRSGPAAALPAANATATLALEGGAARVDARVTAGASTVTVAGRVMPTIDVTASARNVSPSLGAAFVPSLASATGTIGADARVTGTPARPEGTVRLTATDLRVRSGAAAGLPPANITANAALAGTQARIDTRLTAGRNEATVVGTVPLGGSGALGLRANGNVDLAVLNPVVEANGERVLGRLTLAATIEGSVAAPAIRGTGQLTGGDFQDYGAGVHLGSIDAALEANGQTATLTRFSAKAGPGTVSASGSVGLTGTMPVNLTLTARNAQPIASSLVTANLDSNLTVSGAIRTGLALGGNITIDSANIQVPEKLPTTVAVLDVRRPGQAPPAPAQPAVNIALDLTVTAPGRIFIRGRGIDAELEGNLHVSGTSAAPRPSGSFTMRRGTFSIIGRTITFTTGEVFFDGSGKIDPRLNFVASTTTSNGTVANIAVTGYASSPKITLSSTPQLPQDEILAQVLFGQSVASLSPFQLAEIAAAVAQLTGVTGSGNLDVLGSVRKSLGLDQLSIGSGASGNGAALQLGRYVAPGVFLGAQQGTSGGSQATVTIDLTKRLKLKAGVGTPGTATGATTSVDQSGGTSMGLSYQFQY